MDTLFGLKREPLKKKGMNATKTKGAEPETTQHPHTQQKKHRQLSWTRPEGRKKGE